jgi:hypothetical protein
MSWKSLYLSFGDYCYFKENPLNINLIECSTNNTIENFVNIFNNKNEETEDPYNLCDWLINYEINVITKELYQNEIIINYEKKLYYLLQIVKRHFNINEDIILKIFQYIILEDKHILMV